MPRKFLIALAVFLVATAILLFTRRGDHDASTPAPGDRSSQSATGASAPGADTAPGQEPARPKIPSTTPSGMKPGEVRPGPEPGTLLVQPIQPGPPKVIRDNYRVPTPDEDPRIDRRADGRLVFNDAIAMARQLHDEKTNGEADIGLLDGIMSYYRLIYKENPVAGDNAMVIQALTGENEHQIVVFPSDHPDLDANGELLDRWGTPYFFHALTRHQLDIWSAGPDQKFGSFDDLKLGEENESLQLTREEQ